MDWCFALFFSYIIGSIPSGLIVGRFFGRKDLRNFGSHNIGATNAWRVLNAKAGMSVFVMDFLKGVIGASIGMLVIGSSLAGMLTGACAIIGHIFSVFLSFHGGKGIATSFGVLALLMPNVVLIIFIVWLLIVLPTRYVSLGSIIAAMLTPVFTFAFEYPVSFKVFTLLLAILLVLRHKENIVRLKNGRENKI